MPPEQAVQDYSHLARPAFAWTWNRGCSGSSDGFSGRIDLERAVVPFNLSLIPHWKLVSRRMSRAFHGCIVFIPAVENPIHRSKSRLAGKRVVATAMGCCNGHSRLTGNDRLAPDEDTHPVGKHPRKSALRGRIMRSPPSYPASPRTLHRRPASCAYIHSCSRWLRPGPAKRRVS